MKQKTAYDMLISYWSAYVCSSDLRFHFEVVLHASAEPEDRYILEGFSKFAQSVDAKVDASRRRHVGGLCFVAMHAPLDRAKEFLEFTFLRAMRQMPELVALDHFLRSSTPGLRVQPIGRASCREGVCQ